MQSQPSPYQNADELMELNQKINKRFIRDVYKPPKHIGRIPNSSEFFSPEHAPVHPNVIRPFMPQEFHEKFEPPKKIIKMPALHSVPATSTNAPPKPVMTPSPYYQVAKSTPAPTCLDVSCHTTSCPVCSQLYKRLDYMYISVIIFLVIIIMVMWKRKN